jgi:uroporphyrin-III C-methyltransferase
MQPNELIAPGEVWLVGAGPGDPDLLTRKAEKLIAAAEIVFYDALVGPGVLDLIPAGVERVSVGKRSGRHSKAQESINDLLLAAAKAGKRVVRLKGGDPSIFGRSAEEMEHLAADGVRFRICPGITTASAAAASGSASLTLRGKARGLTLVTAHLKAGEPLKLSRQLVAAGRDPETPVMVAVNVSLPTERLIRGKLSALAFLVATISDEDPTLLLIGEAVAGTAMPAETAASVALQA